MAFHPISLLSNILYYDRVIQKMKITYKQIIEIIFTHYYYNFNKFD